MKQYVFLFKKAILFNIIILMDIKKTCGKNAGLKIT